MKWSWRWMIGDYVPCEYGLARCERRAISRAAARQVVSGAISLLYGLTGGIAFGSLQWILSDYLNFGAIMACVVLSGLTLNVLFGMWVARRCWPHIHKALLERGIDVCYRCQYDLRQLPCETTRCPECGWCRPILAGDGSMIVDLGIDRKSG